MLANDLYHQLTQEGFKVFFSRITLEDKLGTAYEPYIFAALNSAKVMVVLGTRPEYFNAVWVRNEWSRYLALVKNSGGKKILIPAYKDMDPYDLPEEFSHLQAQDMSKLGFMQDLIRGVKKIIGASEQKATVKETLVVNAGSGNTAPLLKRVFMFLEDGNWQEADEYCEKVLDIDPECAEAYLGKLMAEKNISRRESLASCNEPFDTDNNYQKAIRFGDEKLKAELSGYINQIKVRNENARLTGIYNNAQATMRNARCEQDYRNAAWVFKSISDFMDSAKLAEHCKAKAEEARKDAIYNDARSKMTSKRKATLNEAIKLFQTISGWRDADEQICACQRKIEEAAREEAERLAKAKEQAKKRKKKFAIGTPIVCACIVFLIVLNTVIIPSVKYNAAMDLLNAKKYSEAITAFKALNGYKDSKAQIDKCNTAIMDGKYNAAMELYNAKKYSEAITAFKALNGYKDSKAQIDKCNTAIMDGKYNAAMELYNAKKYSEAITAFKALNGYKDSAKQIENCYISKFGEQKWNTIKNLKIGDTFTFGKYEQDNNTSNGKEEIEWVVLDKDGLSILLISKFGLDCKQYEMSGGNTTWENCTLRKWLNSNFLNEAFSADETAIIQSSYVIADKNPKYDTDPGNDTLDKLFILSIKEAMQYIDNDEMWKCVATKYTSKKRVAEKVVTVGSPATCWWWLRSPGFDQSFAAYVDYYGAVSDIPVYAGSAAVRPAMWINLDS